MITTILHALISFYHIPICFAVEKIKFTLYILWSFGHCDVWINMRKNINHKVLKQFSCYSLIHRGWGSETDHYSRWWVYRDYRGCYKSLKPTSTPNFDHKQEKIIFNSLKCPEIAFLKEWTSGSQLWGIYRHNIM